MKANFRQGNVEDYKGFVSDAAANKETFTTISSGLTRTIVFPSGSKAKFFGSPNGNNIVDGAFLVRMVQKDVDEYIDKHGVPAYTEHRDVQQFNLSKIREAIDSKKQVPILSIDINACYWNVAHNLGYISDSLYKRGLHTCKKEGLLVSIGCLNKRIVIKEYVQGKLVSTRQDEERMARYAPFYWNVIGKTYELMMQSFELFGDRWYMFLTDCVFVDYAKMKEISQWIRSKGFEVKTNTIEFLELSNNRLVWYDYKAGKRKAIHTLNRDISSSYAIYKISERANE